MLQIQKICFTRAYTCFDKTWAKTLLLRQYQIVSILKKRVVKQVVRGGGGNSEIMAISIQYKDTLDDLINSSDPESPNQERPIDVRFYNVAMSESSLTDLSGRDYLNVDLSDRSSRLASKTKDSQVRCRHIIAPWADYGKS